jgi:hypothetical protein
MGEINISTAMVSYMQIIFFCNRCTIVESFPHDVYPGMVQVVYTATQMD